jgi:hypothetical protein
VDVAESKPPRKSRHLPPPDHEIVVRFVAMEPNNKTDAALRALMTLGSATP